MRIFRFGWLLAVAVIVAVSVPSIGVAGSGGPAAPPPSTAAAPFDPLQATEAYLAKLSPQQRARSDAYFEGGYWLQLWGFLLGAGVGILLLATRLSARMRDLAARVTRVSVLQTALYWVQYLIVTTVLTFPLAAYQGFVREHAYGLSTQSFGGWASDQAKGLAFGVVLGGLGLMAIYAVIRRTPRTWWIWGAAVSLLFVVVSMAISPVFIDPVFNKYSPVTDERITGPILRLARANGIPARAVYVFDASRQTTRVSANVAGFLGTQRIALNDNLLNRCTLPEIESVMAHEMGHYVLNHVGKGVLQFGVLIVLAFAFLRWAFGTIVGRWGPRWGIGGIGDVAGLPLLVLLLSVFFFVLTPVTNTLVRTQEAEADIFGLNAARQPDGEAEVALKLGEYRKLKPGPFEEFVFFDHPSGYTRILMAMRWKAENLPQR